MWLIVAPLIEMIHGELGLFIPTQIEIETKIK